MAGSLDFDIGTCFQKTSCLCIKQEGKWATCCHIGWILRGSQLPITRTVVEKVRVSLFRLNLPPTPPPLTSYKLLPLRPKKMTILHFNDVYNVEPRAKEGVKCCSCVHRFAFPAENLNLKFRNHSLISGQKCERMITPGWIYTLHIQGQTP